ncbi:hypothetical protein B5807_11407 [Epicoccum nigrum]|uniref:FHA domain-containing protein n=1 Tax=Epicoccum nigrum TaxID=105696 RepID=A0A1Y2LJ44_EPING|nr:hypothetical protein B5807_11407 [Epicoccum nigrum]
MEGTFRILLNQESSLDVHDTREFNLDLGKKLVIGRASKNSSKGHLMPAKHNIYIDSPVVSREHATLSANLATGTPHVFVTDTRSMHGTFVNETALVPFVPRQLSSGDKLRFGINVNRNENYYVAYNYTFNAELSYHEPFSRGFTVPEADSEEEELDLVQSGQGSQLHPVVLDDSDDPDDGNTEHPGVDVDVFVGDEGINLFVEGKDEDEDENDDDEELDEGDDGFLQFTHRSAEILGLSVDEDDSDSIADSMVESDIEGEAESDDRPDSALFSPESLPSLEAGSKELAEPHQWPTFDEIQEASVEQVRVDSATNEVVLDQNYSQTYSEYLSMPLEGSAFEVEDASSNPPPLPPRPSQKRRKIEAAQENEDVCEAAPLEPVPSSMPAADRLQTPPFTAPVHAGSPLSPPSTFKNSVLTIPELIDDQPPTPTSIKNLKRSADDAFDDEVEEVTEQEAVESAIEVAVPALPTSDTPLPREAAIPTVEQTVLHIQRPIAQPKSKIRQVLRAAKVVVPATALGAVIAVTALTTLPESFFTVA